jgi:hypothetical protein
MAVFHLSIARGTFVKSRLGLILCVSLIVALSSGSAHAFQCIKAQVNNI